MYKKLSIPELRWLTYFDTQKLSISIKKVVRFLNKFGEECIATPESNFWKRAFGIHTLFAYWGEDTGVSEKITINDKKCLFIDGFRIRDERINDVLKPFNISEAQLLGASKADMKHAPKESKKGMKLGLSRFEKRKKKDKLRNVFEAKPSVAITPAMPMITACWNYISLDSHQLWDKGRDRLLKQHSFLFRMLEDKDQSQTIYDLFGKTPSAIVSQNMKEIEDLTKTHGDELMRIITQTQPQPSPTQKLGG